MAHETLMTEIIVNEAADEEEVQLNQDAEKEDNNDEIVANPPEDVPFKEWANTLAMEIREGFSMITSTDEQLNRYDLGYGTDDVDDEFERMASSDDEGFPGRSWSDGVWIVTPDESSDQRFQPHSE
jgi:hypothetical protein